ncbi:MAG: DNA-directed RNA polymerase subunit omega [Bacteroidales bacterium]|nr:DNA-directed RNA polymerase subunit omega [Bacteroidales bacterium]MBP5644827.1 DNA-directed RNA polymerase subunit omega [Bacteroidales bacterium]
MDETKKKISNTTVTRNTALFSDMTDNIYETVAVLTKRANQIAVDEKKELHKKIEEFNTSDSMDEYYENREQIDIVRQFEQRPKPVLEATEEYLDHKLYYRNPAKEDQQQRKIEELENQIIAEKK